ncbi:protein-tyrosine-phosphatase MKP1-like [Tripterygium wilfordii]|uniref:Protein-tyrosine-phosphatase MKP1-like n=1 Tax=Tripterygium wilfordii TaxID=458696 RepID=A0A7J7DJJ1_TRIWF|nr:protein-tyrosine-phosphatase MKP1-like [Tripterygium wilfordii]KAF5746540.1 protein-tyrosine-phosphatase MKP1-like [Tripterygium wilfordii]
MLGQEDKDRLAGGVARRAYLRSVSWSDRSPNRPNPKPQTNSKARACLPPLQPLSITRHPVEEWPKPGSDDLGVWPNPQTPRESIKALDKSNPGQPTVREFEFKKDKLAFFDKECSRIADHIYLGSDAVAKNRTILSQNGITHVLNCVGFVCPEYFKSDLVYKTLWLQDSPSEDITSILYDVFDYFEDVREQGGRVLVHCCQGVSRSTSLVIAYLMWREGQSFEDAFQYVKAARGVTNPNMGFSCQLLQCQKRVHATPASPNSMLRMYRMAPHSSYDPLHLVPKMLSHPGVKGLDSRGAFIVHVPSAIYVWMGKNCSSAMSNQAVVAANQVIRYERAQGPTLSIKEGEEPPEFWEALACGQFLADGCNKVEIDKEEATSCRNNKMTAVVHTRVGERKVDEYDLDFELFHKALAGGVVPPFSVSNNGSETCLPARENGWSRLRQKFAQGMMKELVTAAKVNCETVPFSDGSQMEIDASKEVEHPVSLIECSSPLSPSARCSPDSFDCFPDSSASRISDTCKEAEYSTSLTDSSLPPRSPYGSPDSFSCLRDRSPKFGSKSPTLSPSTSDYSSSSFTFSPSSSNWSDLSRQPSPSGLEAVDPFSVKKSFSYDNYGRPYEKTAPLPADAFSAGPTLRVANTCFPCKGSSLSIAERRGSNPPPRMFLQSVDEPSQGSKNLTRSWSFSLPDIDDDMMMDVQGDQIENESEELVLGAVLASAVKDSEGETESKEVSGKFHRPSVDGIIRPTTPILYQWPTMNKVDMNFFCELDAKSIYMLLAPNVSLDSDNPCNLFVWLGREVFCEEELNQSINTGGTCKNSHLQWEMIGRNFLDQMNLPVNIPVQMVVEGMEPEEFLSHLNCFSFQKLERKSHC